MAQHGWNWNARADVPVAALAGIAAVAGSYVANGLTPSFVAAPVSSLVVALTPDAVVTASILVLGDLGHQLGFMLALALTAVLFGVLALVGLGAARYAGSVAIGGAIAGLFAWLAAVGLTGEPVAALAAATPPAAAVALAGLSTLETPTDRVSETRRTLLGVVAGGVGLAGIAAVVGSRGQPGVGTAAPPSNDWEADGEIDSLLGDADERSLDVAGLEPLVSDEFYEVDINSVNPTVDASEWTLSVTGAVEQEVTVDYANLLDRPREHRFVSLRCVGEGLNGKKMDNALWTGTPIVSLLEEAGPISESCCVMLRAADDYFEEFPLAALRTGFIAYGMNGEALPRGHGHPVRALIPGHWGEINVKWLTEIEVLDEPADGYWERRGWHGTGPVNAVAKLWAENRLDDGRYQVAGHAYAGTRGIERVEVSTDGGATWNQARLSEPLPGDDVWRQWAYEFEPSGSHEVVVRAIDGEGTVQKREESKPFPRGATGWVRKTVRE